MNSPSNRPLKRVCRQVIEPNRSARPFIAMEHIEAVTGRITGEHDFASVQGDQFLDFMTGDTLFGKLRPYLRKVALADREGCCVSEFLVLRPLPGYDARFLCWTLRSTPVADHAMLTAEGAKMPRTSWEKLGGFRIADWSLREQQRIADYLDRETTRIDALIEKAERYVALLDERRASLLTEALTGANLPCKTRLDAILGRLPMHWPVYRLKHLLPDITVGVVVNPSSYFVDDGVPFIHGSDVREGHIDVQSLKFLSREDNRRLSKSMLRSGDVVVVRAGYPGRAAVVPPALDGCNCASILILRRSERLLPKYLEAFMNSSLGQAQVGIVQYGAAQEQINVSHVVNFVIPVPDLAEQADICARIQVESDRIERLQQLSTHRAQLLRERRTALITAAVIGDTDASKEAA